MTRDAIKKLYPRASEAFIRANLDAGDTGPDAVVERPAIHEPLAANQGEEGATGKLFIRFVSVRKRLLDPDNLAEKWLLDCLRYCRAIHGDEPEKISIETTQRKAAKGETEHTEIAVWSVS